MRIPESWLRAYCNPDVGADELEHRLTMSGLEVEERTSVAPPFSGVVVARVQSTRRHPDADRLTVCEVDAGDAGGAGQSLQIVCGAPNVRPGLVTALALPGASLPGGIAIKVSKMRGVESQGMLCSSKELALADDHSGLVELAPELVPGTDLRQALQLDENVFLMKLTPNLAHCMSVTGVAQEVSAITGAPYEAPSWRPVVPTLDERLPVRISAPELCGRFSGRIVRGVDAHAQTPAWVRERLERAGQRPISALVDISNYVMLELGRPTHVFDLDRIEGGLEVRWGRAGEQLQLLNGQTVELGEQDGLRVGVIADASRVESLAGIMGGEATAVTQETRNIYLEAAFWWPTSIAGRSRRYNFATDAGQRFERGVDPSTTVDHLEYLTSLVLSVCGGHAGPVDDTITGLPERKPVTLRVARARKVSGLDLTLADCTDAFERLGLSYAITQADVIEVTPPPRRFDLSIEEDLIEEVVRLYGFERIGIGAPRAAAKMRPAPEGRLSTLTIKRRWAARDYQEVVNYSFVSSREEQQLGQHLVSGEALALLNPIAENLDVMRTTLWSGLLSTLVYNVNRKADRIRLFELGRAYLRAPGQPDGPLAVAGVAQPLRVAALAYGPTLEEQWGAPTRQADFFDLKGDLLAAHHEADLQLQPTRHPALHPGQSARILDPGGAARGWIGMLHPRLQEELNLPRAVLLCELDLDDLLQRPVPAPRSSSKYPPAIRDLAVIVEDQVLAGELLRQILRYAKLETTTACIRNVKLFDEYRGKGLETKEKSLAFRFWMQDTDRTLSDSEVDAAVASVLQYLVSSHGARLRA
ncbi:MAG: phenylalanine--tRNA ligase subunit beta [Lautropia sp.]|nr:phenylalanine--tRNA ligase subunit beta [Lautropia sp.]